jgi:hypothetical protein
MALPVASLGLMAIAVEYGKDGKFESAMERL